MIHREEVKDSRLRYFITIPVFDFLYTYEVKISWGHDECWSSRELWSLLCNCLIMHEPWNKLEKVANTMGKKVKLLLYTYVAILEQKGGGENAAFRQSGSWNAT